MTKGATMMRRQPEGGQCTSMRGRAVAGVPRPIVAAIACIKCRHQSITGDLGNDGSAGDGITAGVAPDHGRVVDAQRAQRQAIKDDVMDRGVRPPGRERAGTVGDRPLHGQHGRVMDIERVDFTRGGGPETKRYGSVPNGLRQSNARRGIESLGVVHADNGASVNGKRHDDGACDNGARERAPSDFIDSGKERAIRRTQGALDPAPPPHGESLTRRCCCCCCAAAACARECDRPFR
jgi:hypothetical protein